MTTSHRITNSTLPRQYYKTQKVYPEIIAEVYQCIYGEIWGTSFDSGDVDPGINVNLLLRNAAIQPQLSEGKGKFATRLVACGSGQRSVVVSRQCRNRQSLGS